MDKTGSDLKGLEKHFNLIRKILKDLFYIPLIYKTEMATIINPLTGRRITIGKTTHRKVIKLQNSIAELRTLANKQLLDTREKKEKAKKTLLKLDVADLLRNAKKQLAVTREKKNKAKDKILKMDIDDLLRNAKKHISRVNAKKR